MRRLKSLTKWGLCSLLQASGAAWLAERREHRRRPSLAILIFHRVTDEIPADGLTVATATFRALCKALARNFHVVSLAEVFRQARGREPFPPRTVALTFDDSYRDNLAAARVLAEHGLPACFFLPTAFIGSDRSYPWDRHLPPRPNLTWDDVQEMARLGHEIGSHTVTHPNMGAVSESQARQELVQSRRELEGRLGQRVRWFAYPFGGRAHFRDEWLPLVAEAGYEGTVSAYGGLVYPGGDTRILPREPVPGFDSLLHMQLHLRGSLNWYYSLRERLGLPARPALGEVGTPPPGATPPPVRTLAAIAPPPESPTPEGTVA